MEWQKNDNIMLYLSILTPYFSCYKILTPFLDLLTNFNY